MIKREMVIDELELNDEGRMTACKGRVIKVVEIDEMEHNFLSHRFDRRTRCTLFFAQFRLDYCGG